MAPVDDCCQCGMAPMTPGHRTDDVVRTLVVEDDATARRLHTEYVRSVKGFVVVNAVETGRAAADLATSTVVDLVLLDIDLPDFSGIEVLRRIRRVAAAVDVIVITGARDRVTVRQAMSANVADYLVKPFTRSALTSRLAAYRAGREVPGVAPEDSFGQHQIDQILARDPGLASGASRASHAGGTGPDGATLGPLPKGFSATTVEVICAQLDSGQARTARQVADAAGLSRATARRYLDLLHDRGRVDVSHRYGRRGRPELLYRVAP